MTDNFIETELQKIPTPIQKIISLSSGWHSYFENLWNEKQNKFSYHNSAHVSAGLKAARMLVDQSTKEFVKDPLDIIRDLNHWNETQSPKNQITIDELREIIEIAFACHDLGNICRQVKNDNDQLEPDFLDIYTETNAEERSKEIAKTIIKNSRIEDGKKEKYVKLVTHLIGHTTYQGNSQKPFAIL